MRHQWFLVAAWVWFAFVPHRACLLVRRAPMAGAHFNGSNCFLTAARSGFSSQFPNPFGHKFLRPIRAEGLGIDRADLIQ